MNALTIHAPQPSFSMGDLERMATAIAKGRLFGSEDPNAVLTLCLLAQAEGKHPALIMQDFHIIKGKPAKKAEAMLRDFIISGGKVEWHQLDDNCADATFTHPAGSARISWDHARAKKAQLANNAMYQKFPRQMLRSRVISEGIRTVYPGATSGLYEVDEVKSFDDTSTAEPIDITPEPNVTPMLETGERDDAPNGKVVGISKIKARLGAMMTVGNGLADEDEFRKLVKANRDDIKTIRDANHAWWTGDGDDWEGFGAWLEKRRAELAEKADDSLGLQMLVSALEECACRDDLNSLMDQHEAVVEALSDVESRKFGRAFDQHEAAIMAAAPLGAG